MIKRIRGKRAQFFTILAIILIILMFVSIEIYSSIHERKAIRARVASMDSFLKALEANLERQMYISGFRIIYLAQIKVDQTRNYIPDIHDFFNETFFYGTVDGTPESIMIGVTYYNLTDSINEKAAKINVEVILDNTTIYVEQEDPWNVKFTMSSDFIMRDVQSLALWQTKKNISALIPVTRFGDPIFNVEARAEAPYTGRVTRNITKTPYEGMYAECPDIANFSDHFAKGYYAANPNAPSFLKRLEGDLTPDPNGIETLVNTDTLNDNGVDIDYFDPLPRDESVADYIYFNESYHVSGTDVDGTPSVPSYLLLDDDHKTRYNVTDAEGC